MPQLRSGRGAAAEAPAAAADAVDAEVTRLESGLKAMSVSAVSGASTDARSSDSSASAGGAQSPARAVPSASASAAAPSTPGAGESAASTAPSTPQQATPPPRGALHLRDPNDSGVPNTVHGPLVVTFESGDVCCNGKVRAAKAARSGARGGVRVAEARPTARAPAPALTPRPPRAVVAAHVRLQEAGVDVCARGQGRQQAAHTAQVRTCLRVAARKAARRVAAPLQPDVTVRASLSGRSDVVLYKVEPRKKMTVHFTLGAAIGVVSPAQGSLPQGAHPKECCFIFKTQAVRLSASCCDLWLSAVG